MRLFGTSKVMPCYTSREWMVYTKAENAVEVRGFYQCGNSTGVREFSTEPDRSGGLLTGESERTKLLFHGIFEFDEFQAIMKSVDGTDHSAGQDILGARQ